VKEGARERTLEYVRPLAAGLDGLTNFGDVERALAAAGRIAAGTPGADPDLLFLLAVFSGQDRWVVKLGHRSRTEIFLESQGVPRRTIAALFRGLGRLQASPRTLEERIAHDAVALDAMGAYGVARLVAEAYRERLAILEIAASVEEAARRPLFTEEAEALALPRRAAMRDFAARLRAEHEEFGGEAAR
jgi:hypothetical protein